MIWKWIREQLDIGFYTRAFDVFSRLAKRKQVTLCVMRLHLERLTEDVPEEMIAAAKRYYDSQYKK
jgi:hypothetical protein